MISVETVADIVGVLVLIPFLVAASYEWRLRRLRRQFLFYGNHTKQCMAYQASAGPYDCDCYIGRIACEK